MTSPPQQIRVECPRCGPVFEDWMRGSVNLDLEGWDPDAPEVQEYLRECSTCRHVAELDTLVVRQSNA